MERLNKKISKAVDRQVKVLQFGEGNFLRAFVDYMFDVVNEKTDFNGGVVIVKPIEFGNLDRFHDQECQYTLQLRGIVDGEPKKETRIITTVTDAVAAIEDYDKYDAYAKLDSLRFVVSIQQRQALYLMRQTSLPLSRLRHSRASLPSSYMKDMNILTEQPIRVLS